MADLILVRHGETDWNRDGRYQGHADPPLNETGRAQARELARKLQAQELDAIYTSDLRRAAETAAIIHFGREIPLVMDGGLREIDVGSWSGLTREQIEQRFPGATSHDGETRDHFRERVVSTATSIASRNDGARILVVSHGGWLRALLSHALEDDAVPRVENCAIYRVAFKDGVLRGID